MADDANRSEEHRIRGLLMRLLPVTESFSQICETVPCRDGWCKHFEFPEGVTHEMRWAVNVAFEVIVLGWDMNHSGRLNIFQRAADSWRAVGVLR